MAVFLDVNCPGVEMIILAVGSNVIPADVYIRGATVGMRRFLEQQPNVTVWNDHAACWKPAQRQRSCAPRRTRCCATLYFAGAPAAPNTVDARAGNIELRNWLDGVHLDEADRL